MCIFINWKKKYTGLIKTDDTKLKCHWILNDVYNQTQVNKILSGPSPWTAAWCLTSGGQQTLARPMDQTTAQGRTRVRYCTAHLQFLPSLKMLSWWQSRQDQQRFAKAVGILNWPIVVHSIQFMKTCRVGAAELCKGQLCASCAVACLPASRHQGLRCALLCSQRAGTALRYSFFPVLKK